uniref:Phosphoenolpyruvate carboxykinase n=1 Tax=Caenorhabditis tropicalis TaxID=1561998 RepID=A0A1I7UX45_9PELO
MEKHEDVLEMTSQFMEANEVEEFTNIDGNMLVQPNEDLFFKLNEKQGNLLVENVQEVRRYDGATNEERRPDVVITERYSGCSYPPPTMKIIEEKGIQVDPIETVVDKLEKGDGHVAVGRIRPLSRHSLFFILFINKPV